MAIIPERIRIKIQWLLIRGQKYPVFNLFSRWWCRLGAWRVCRLLLKLPAVEAVYSRHTHPNAPSFVPGHSDLDATIALSEDGAQDPAHIAAVSKRVEKLSWFHFYLSPDDIRFTSSKELERITRNYSSPYEPLYTPDDWILLAGSEVRSAKAMDFPERYVPWHPEFNRFWQHVLQDYLLVRKPGLEDQYLRVFYRSALRQQLQFLAALGEKVPKPLGHVDDEMVETAFSDNPEFLPLLSDLKRRGFWGSEPQALKERILLAVFQSAAKFFNTYRLHPKLISCASPEEKNWENHHSAYDVLKARMEQCNNLTSMLTGIIVYPVPHHLPYFYHVDLLVPEDLSATSLGEIVRSTENEFKSREFFLDGHGYSITYLPESTLNWALLYLGSPYPFLREHIQRYGMCILGEEPPDFEKAWQHTDLIQWCRVFLPYYMITLGRRIEHSSRSINFCQLASIRVFLESGQKETDPEILRKCYRDILKEQSPDDEVWNYMLKDKPGRQNTEEYRVATVTLLKECERVERLLEEYRAASS